MNKIVDLKGLCAAIKELKSQGKKIAATSGCFDILHAGHAMYLKQAKDLADALVVMLNSDSSVRGLKGPERPIVPQDERAQVLAALEYVDYVCLFDEPTPCPAYAQFRPDIIAKGGDYKGKHIPEMDAAAAWGGKVAYVDLLEGRSTTNIIEKIKALAKKE